MRHGNTGVRGLYGMRSTSANSDGGSTTLARGSMQGLHASSGPPISLIVRGGSAGGGDASGAGGAGGGGGATQPQRPLSAPSLRSGSTPYLSGGAGGSGGFALLQSTSSAVPLYGEEPTNSVEQRLRIVKRGRGSSRDLHHQNAPSVVGHHHHHHHTSAGGGVFGVSGSSHGTGLMSSSQGGQLSLSGIVREPSREKPVAPPVPHVFSRCELGVKMRADDPIHALVSDAFDALLFAPEDAADDNNVTPPRAGESHAHKSEHSTSTNNSGTPASASSSSHHHHQHQQHHHHGGGTASFGAMRSGGGGVPLGRSYMNR